VRVEEIESLFASTPVLDKSRIRPAAFTRSEMSTSSARAAASKRAQLALARMASGAGYQLREERIRRGWPLAVVAERAGISIGHLCQIEAGKPASLDSYARVAVALDRRPELSAVDPRQRSGRATRDEDLVHAAMGEVEAARLSGFGFALAIDEPYQHYQFAGRADVVCWDLAARALLHIENRTGFPNVQESLGSYASKRAYLGRVLADRVGLRGGWRSETHVIAALWSSEVLHVLRMREATFRAACPDGIEPVRAWWTGGRPANRGVTSSMVLLDPAPGVRAAFRIGEVAPATRPRYRGYAEAAEALRASWGAPSRPRPGREHKTPERPDH
jgi:transcriptional regulator with XRE-family HTH domain